MLLSQVHNPCSCYRALCHCPCSVYPHQGKVHLQLYILLTHIKVKYNVHLGNPLQGNPCQGYTHQGEGSLLAPMFFNIVQKGYIPSGDAEGKVSFLK